MGDELMTWRPIRTVPLDGSWLLLLGFDGSDFDDDDTPIKESAWIVRTRWIQPPDEETFELVSDGLYRRHAHPQTGYWRDVPGQLEYVYAWMPDPARLAIPDDLKALGPPIDTRLDDFEELAALRAHQAAK